MCLTFQGGSDWALHFFLLFFVSFPDSDVPDLPRREGNVHGFPSWSDKKRGSSIFQEIWDLKCCLPNNWVVGLAPAHRNDSWQPRLPVRTPITGSADQIKLKDGTAWAKGASCDSQCTRLSSAPGVSDLSLRDGRLLTLICGCPRFLENWFPLEPIYRG